MYIFISTLLSNIISVCSSLNPTPKDNKIDSQISETLPLRNLMIFTNLRQVIPVVLDYTSLYFQLISSYVLSQHFFWRSPIFDLLWLSNVTVHFTALCQCYRIINYAFGKIGKEATTASYQVPSRHMPKTHCSEEIKCHDRDSIESPPDYEAHNFACDERTEVPCEQHRKVGKREIGTDILTTCHVPRRPAGKQSPK